MAIQNPILGFIIGALVSFSFGAAESKSGSEGGDECRQGRRLYASGDVLKALNILEKCLAREPRNREAWVTISNAALETGRFQQSAEAFAKADALKPGDEDFLLRYLSALEGAGLTDAQVPVLKALAGGNSGSAVHAERLLATVETLGPNRFPDEYLFALQTLTERRSPDRYRLEKLAAAYLSRGQTEKAEAEYRGLLVKTPESAESWAGLGASQAERDPQAASECYRKAALYSNQAGQRHTYQSEHKRLAKTAQTAKSPKSIAKTAPEDPLEALTMPDPVPAVAKPQADKKPFDVKAFQDSVYQAELAKRLAALKVPGKTPPAASVPSSTGAVAIANAGSPGARGKEMEKERQESMAKENEKKAKEEKAKEEKARQETAAKETERMAREERAKQDALAKEAEQKVKEEKSKQEALAKGEKLRQEAIAKESERKATEEKLRQEAIAKEAEQKAREDKLKQEALAMERARLAEAEKARRDAEERKRADAEKERVAKEENLKSELEQRARVTADRRDRHTRAVAMYNTGVLDSAAALFKMVLADSPSTEAYYFAGRIALERGEYAKSLEYLDKVPADKPDLDVLKGKALSGMGRHMDALHAFERQYAKLKSDSLLEPMIVLKRKIGDEAGAISYLEKLAEARPGVEAHQSDLAVHYRKAGDKARTVERYGKVLALNPSHGEANYYLGMRAAWQGDHARAVPLLERAVAVFPNRADAWKALAKGDAALGRKAEAWEAHAKAIALSPADLELAKGRMALARYPEFASHLPGAYESVLRLAPEDPEASLGLAHAKFQAGDFPAAERYFRIACKSSNDSRAWSRFGKSLLELKKPDEAALAFQKAVDLGEKDPSLRTDLLRIKLEKGDADGAEVLAKDLGKKSPADPEPLYWQGRIALKRQQVAVAEEFFRKANRMKADDGRFAEALARLHRDKDEFKPAISVLAAAENDLTPSGRLLYGDCLAYGGEAAKAGAVYAALYGKEPSAPLLSRRIDLLVLSGKADQAVELGSAGPFRESADVRYATAKAHLSLIEAHVLKGDAGQAVHLMKKVVKTGEHKPEFHFNLGRAYQARNQPKKAVGAFTDALVYRVDYPDALYRKGLCQLKLDKADDAERALGELSQHADPVWKARGLYGLALVFEARGKPEAVEHHLALSLAAAPLPEAMTFLSKVSLANSKAEAAQDWARKALAADPANEGATVALGDALAASKRQSEAMELARRGLLAMPRSCGLLVQSAKLNFQAGKLDSTLAAGNDAIRACPEEPMGYYYAGVATHGTNRPDEAKGYFKSFRKLGGDKKLVPGN